VVYEGLREDKPVAEVRRGAEREARHASRQTIVFAWSVRSDAMQQRVSPPNPAIA
jgi:hypothetical protein